MPIRTKMPRTGNYLFSLAKHIAYDLSHATHANTQLFSSIGDVAHDEHIGGKGSGYKGPDVITLPLGQRYRVSTRTLFKGV